MKFAREHIPWTEEDWKRVVWSDEMGMQTDANQGFKWVWRYPEEEYDEDCCRGTVISGFRKVKVLGRHEVWEAFQADYSSRKRRGRKNGFS